MFVSSLFFFFFNDTATTEIYTLSLHDALPISFPTGVRRWTRSYTTTPSRAGVRSEEHTSELQSRRDLVCRLLLEKKKKKQPSRSEKPPASRSAGTSTTAEQPNRAISTYAAECR